MSLRSDGQWHYCCAPEVDVIEVTPDLKVIAYELKGARRYRKGGEIFRKIREAGERRFADNREKVDE